MDREQPVSVVAAHESPVMAGLRATPVAAAARTSVTSASAVALNLALTVVCTVAVAVVLGLSVGPRFLAYETFIVRSGSMEPAIGTGALVIVQPIEPRLVRVGDVITYRRPEDPDTTITHRVVEVRPGPSGGAAAAPIFRTRGDANNAVDPWEVQLQGVAWRVTFDVPLAGFLFAFTQQPLGRALFLIVPGLGLGALWLQRTWLRLRQGA
jgi:signal peptidase